MNTKTFVFAVPDYDTRSHGVQIFYNIAKRFSDEGHTVLLTPQNGNNCRILKNKLAEINLAFEVVNQEQVQDDFIPVFTDSAPPEFTEQFNSIFRVWYLLNTPYAMTGRPCQYRATDLVLSFSSAVSDNYPIFFINMPNEELIDYIRNHRRRDSKNNQIAFYFGKSRLCKPPKSVAVLAKKHKATIVYVNRVVPYHRRQLWRLISSSRLVVSADPMTNLNYECTLLGVPCFLADNYNGVSLDSFDIPLQGIFEDEAQLEQMFVQGLNSETREKIAESFHTSVVSNTRTIQQMLACIESHYCLIYNGAEGYSLELLHELNTARLEADRSRYQANKGLQKNHSFLGKGYSVSMFLTSCSNIKYLFWRFLNVLLYVSRKCSTSSRDFALSHYRDAENKRRWAELREARKAQLAQMRRATT